MLTEIARGIRTASRSPRSSCRRWARTVRPRVDYWFGDAIAALEEGADAIRVRFDSGREEDYALVLVAEGVGSSTRELVFAGENDPRWMDMKLGFFTIPKGEVDGSASRWYNAPGGRSIFLRPTPTAPRGRC